MKSRQQVVQGSSRAIEPKSAGVALVPAKAARPVRPRVAPPPAVAPTPPAQPGEAPPVPLVGLPLERDSYAATAFGDIVDRSVHAATARFTGGMSPAALAGAYMDWALHLAAVAGQADAAGREGDRKAAGSPPMRPTARPTPAMPGERCIEPLPRTSASRIRAWQHWPFNLIHQAFLLQPAVVAQRDDRGARRDRAARGRGAVHRAPDARHVLAVQLSARPIPEVLRAHRARRAG